MRLHLSPNSATGYLGVYLERGKFCAQTKVGGRGAPRIFLGSFGTAVEAAVAYARRVGEAAAPEERQETELRRWFPAIYEIDGKWRLCFVGKTSSSSDWWRTSGCVERLGDSARASTRFRTVNGTVYLLVGKCEVSPSRSTGYLDPNALRYFAQRGGGARASTRADDGEAGEGRGPSVPVEEAEGLRLHLSRCSNTGYRGVTRCWHSAGRFRALRGCGLSRGQVLGYFDTAVDAAVAVEHARAADVDAQVL
ncbi:hypothetical protein EMIHUDRAFT_216623 [Emiliania huxleyi CCMP1516]|uniref:AP2/ERF domain-containing protein n=2 Tax=Emiliania huxleyi TaxID=2903 RepID=A0A0D3IDB6_EMIH1|nr:hypothetical protein EMIHUDRAFT_216623 [Emiliania huxleyi CCMP1516]EOD09251.1 hypothetical protein EMIHUDRAFT_216623 [Emiliania huxleyi CCMP1516]|eukprot:XP_005761680.1 hypothetical protein EMIHUDRAFT_216623 [Emiliania huxleyi CCMP1516]